MTAIIFGKRVKKIAVLRANALGDFIFVLPALQALKHAYPDAELVYLGRQWHREFLLNRPGSVDRVVVIPPFNGVGEDEDYVPDKQRIDDFFIRMRKEKFDIALQLHGGGKNSNPFLLRLGARLTAGLRTADAAALDLVVPYVYYQSEVMRYLEVVSLVGASPKVYEPQISVTKEDERQAALAADHLFDTPYVVLHPGATDPRRRWSAGGFAQVGDALAKKGFRIFLTGLAKEQGLTEEVAKRMEASAEDLCGKLSLSGLAGLLAHASAVIANDTGPLHLAEAVGAPTVGIYWCGNLINGGPFGRRRHHPLLSWIVDCPLCGMDCASARPFDRDNRGCQHLVSFVTGVRVEEAVQAALDLVSAKTTSAMQSRRATQANNIK